LMNRQMKVSGLSDSPTKSTASRHQRPPMQACRQPGPITLLFL
jgi:hypothetical protein